MRARNPCLLTRFRLRGLYVGFIPSGPIHFVHAIEGELDKIVGRRARRQRLSKRVLKSAETPHGQGRCLTFPHQHSSFGAPPHGGR